MTSRRTPAAPEEPPSNEPPPGSIADVYREAMPLVSFEAEMTKGDDVALTIPVDSIHEVIERGREDERLQMNLLRNQTAVDWEERGLEIVYHLYSIPLRQAVTIKSWLPSEGAIVESITDIYEMANWAERECREMFGIEFIGHPDPRNLLLDEDIDIHPLRKSHPLAPIEMEQGVDVEFFTKQHPPPEPAEEEEAAPDAAAAAAPERKRVEDMTEEEREERRAEQAERVARARELAAVRRAERLAGAPPAGGPRPEGAAPPPPPAAAPAAVPAAEAAPAGAPAQDDRPPAPPPPELPSIPDAEEDPEGRAAAQAERVRLGRELAAARRAQLRGD
ncbi:MAG: NADH-quinone oxidoreductase subunit C [Chloroflexota bacterium]|nr:NADH-quinone oxidoreductase subunit C [Chloroflexota bacterium]